MYLLHGEEPLQLLEAQDAIRQAAKQQGFSIREVYSAESGFSWQTLQFANDALSLFADKKLIEIQIPSGKPGAQGAEALIQLAKSPSPDNVIVITLPVRLDKTTQNSKWFTALSQQSVIVPVFPLERHQLPTWLNDRLGKQKQFIDDATAHFLADRVEGNLLAAHQEIQKLALLYPAGELSLSQVQEAVLNVARYDVFKLSEAALSGDIPRFKRMLAGLKDEGEAPTLVAWTLTEDAHILYRILKGKREGIAMNQLFRDNRVWGNKQDLVTRSLKRLSPGDVLSAVKLSSIADRACKGVHSQDPWFVLEQLGLILCGVKTLPTEFSR